MEKIPPPRVRMKRVNEGEMMMFYDILRAQLALNWLKSQAIYNFRTAATV